MIELQTYQKRNEEVPKQSPLAVTALRWARCFSSTALGFSFVTLHGGYSGDYSEI